jgi:hypothetical protein
MGMTEKALSSFDDAEKASPYVGEATGEGAEFRARVAAGRAEAERRLQQK